jgi:nicotinate-nucleotide pyrophosphorylase (carboxylating)
LDDRRAIAVAVARALEEDDVRHDVTTALLQEAARHPGTGRFVTEAPCVLAGGPVVAEVFGQLDAACTVEQVVAEGTLATPGATVLQVSGTVATLLAGERVALNFLQRLSGIATATRRAVEAVAGTGAKITDTRKTTPGLRALERYAVRMGGGVNHRFSLGAAVLWKDNHWAMLGATGMTLREALMAAPPEMPVIVEVETEAQFLAALEAGVSRLLVDNQLPDQVADWVGRAGPAVEIEASGGINAGTAEAFARAGATYLSMGGLTHTVQAAPIRMDLTG